MNIITFKIIYKSFYRNILIVIDFILDKLKNKEFNVKKFYNIKENKFYKI